MWAHADIWTSVDLHLINYLPKMGLPVARGHRCQQKNDRVIQSLNFPTKKKNENE